MDFSQQGRAASGFVSAALYGDESWESTGYISIQVFRKAFEQTSEKDYILIWDEPEIGLSEESQLGVTQLIKQKMVDGRDPRLLGCVFMTHSRLFVKQFLDYPKLGFVDMDGKFDSAAKWASRKVRPANLEKVCKRGHERFQKITKMLKD
jgi:hypothetical protein